MGNHEAPAHAAHPCNPDPWTVRPMTGGVHPPLSHLALALAVVAIGACSGGAHHSSARRGIGAPTSSGATSSTLSPAGATTTTLATTTTRRQDPAAARAALKGYLEAVAAKKAKAIVAHSEGAAAALGGIRTLIAQINAAARATTTTRVQDEVFQPQSVTPTVVVYGGSAHLATDVQGPKGSQHSVSTISGPVTVARVRNSWRVKDFVYDGAPLVYAGEYATDTQAGVQLHVGLVLSYANFTTAVVQLTAQSQRVDLTLTSATLTTSAGTTAAMGSGFTRAGHPPGFIAFGRTDGVPTRLAASFRRGDGSTVAFAVPLRGQPS